MVKKETIKGLKGMFWTTSMMWFVALSLALISKGKFIESIITFFLAVIGYKFLDYNFEK